MLQGHAWHFYSCNESLMKVFLAENALRRSRSDYLVPFDTDWQRPHASLVLTT